MSFEYRPLQAGGIVQAGDVLGHENGPKFAIDDPGVGEPHLGIMRIFRQVESSSIL